MITLLIILWFIAICMLTGAQFLKVRDYKPLRYITWEGLIEHPQNPRFRYCAVKRIISVF